MRTTPNQLHIEAARILKNSSWNYEYCYPEKVSESIINQHISEIEMGVNKENVEDLANKICSELEYNPPYEQIDNAEALAKFVAHDIAIHYVDGYVYETVTFKIC